MPPMPRPPSAAARPCGAPPRAAEGEEAEPAQQRTIVIMHQKVKLRFVPPGVGKLLVGERLLGVGP